ncbi:MAG TPA: lysozyme inhibitor LprI family protein [Solirubrobacteraceae bacterium]|nr:lysozyme inhibitor LprI family protein [Solirubrobacteraceae bacterium]
MRTRSSLLLGLASAAALIATSAVVLSTTAAAGAAGSPGHARLAKLAPPVIHESFTPLPCTGAPGHRTTLEMEGCAEQQILTSDKRIDALNQEIFGKLFDAAARRRFIAGHNAWLTYRHAYCLSASDVFEGGTEAGVADATCTAAVNSQHVTNLKAFLADFGPAAG